MEVLDSDKKFIRERLLHIMDFVDEVCKTGGGIEYSLCGGSMIGAVRHKGFIPWDDDIDIAMSRDNYNRFVSVIDEQCQASNEFVFVTQNRRVPIVTYKDDVVYENKVFLGIRVDIFIIDNLPDEKSKRKKLIFKMKVLQGMMHKGKIDWSKYNFKGKLQLFGTRFLGSFRSYKSLINSYNKLAKSYDNRLTKYQFISNDVHAMFHIPYNREWFESCIDVPFEGRTYRLFSEYDKILRASYGEYMIPPPESEREFLHTDIRILEDEHA